MVSSGWNGILDNPIVNTVTAPFKFVWGLGETAVNTLLIPVKTAWGGASKGIKLAPTGSLWGFVTGAAYGAWKAVQEGRNPLTEAVGTGALGAMGGAGIAMAGGALVGVAQSGIESTGTALSTGAQTLAQLAPSSTPSTPSTPSIKLPSIG
jgi:hypothetical protein